MLKIRRPLGRLIFSMGIAIPGKTVFLIETVDISISLYRMAYPVDSHIWTYHLVTSVFGYAMFECIGSYYWYVIYERQSLFYCWCGQSHFHFTVAFKMIFLEDLQLIWRYLRILWLYPFFILLGSTGEHVLVFLFLWAESQAKRFSLAFCNLPLPSASMLLF